MIKSAMAVLTMTILVAATAAFGQPAGLLDGSGNALSVNGPLEFVIDESVPTSLIPAILAAFEGVNKFSKHQVSAVTYPSSGTKQGVDGVNVISFDRTWDGDRSREMSRMTVYWSDRKINEVDLRINGMDFDFESDPGILSQSIGNQLIRMLKIETKGQAGSIEI